MPLIDGQFEIVKLVKRLVRSHREGELEKLWDKIRGALELSAPVVEKAAETGIPQAGAAYAALQGVKGFLEQFDQVPMHETGDPARTEDDFAIAPPPVPRAGQVGDPLGEEYVIGMMAAIMAVTGIKGTNEMCVKHAIDIQRMVRDALQQTEAERKNTGDQDGDR